VRSPKSEELETSLLVVSRRPGPVLRRLAAIRQIGDYDLVPRATERFRDTYFDTPGGDLGARGIALRIRDFGGEGPARITLKTLGRRVGTVTAREEIEVRSSEAGARRILARLRRLGIRAPLPSPREFVRGRDRSRLRPSQIRTNRRQVRDVMREGRRVAELAIDHVVFRFGGSGVRLEEVEIEAKDRGTARDVERLARALLERLGSELRAWSASKLATGMALEAWSRSGQLTPRLTPAKRLGPSWFSRLAKAAARL
jgi:inorganic triphosphatase YgiF